MSTQAPASIAELPLTGAFPTIGTRNERTDVRLHQTKAKRELDSLKEGMKLWDDVTEQQKEEGKKRWLLEQQQDDDQPNKKKSHRLGPEKWKLRGVVRPAWRF